MSNNVVVCALYKFAVLNDYKDLRQPLLNLMQQNGVHGTLLLAREGINGTIAGSRAGIDAVKAWLGKDERFEGIDYKKSFVDIQPFKRTKVKLKKEIVTMGIQGIDPKRIVGTYVDPKARNDLVSDPDVLVIDTRNQYEVEVGTFRNAVNPATDSFREFPAYVKENLGPQKHKKVAMFCTGGIRCEKSTAYLKEQGFEEQRREYRQGVSCHQCIDRLTEEQKARFAERERQIRLARERGEVHVGGEAARIIAERKACKKAERARQAEQSLQGEIQ